MAFTFRRGAMGVAFALTCLPLLTGCGSEKAAPLTTDEKAKFTAPLGQPMPPEAKAAMERAGKSVPPAPGSTPTAPAPR